MSREGEDDSLFEGALIVNGFIPEDHLWSGLNEFLKEIEDLPQPVPWNGFCAWSLNISVHRKTVDGNINPPLEWAASALSSPNPCAAIAFRCSPLGDEPDQDDSFGWEKCYFRDLARTFTYAANIARPACLTIHSIAMRCPDGSCEVESGTVHALEGAVDYSQKTGLPSLAPVPFGSVWYWIGHNGFHLRSGDTPVSRAFNAYTWLFEGSSFPFSLVSALIGIEALFASSTSGVGDQVRRRTQLLLGNRTSFKKDLDKMYAARSAFLHGGTLVPPNGFSWDPPQDVEAKLGEIWDATDIASAVLVSSLQRLAEKGWTALEFSENLTGMDSEQLESVEETISSNRIPYAEKSKLEEWGARFIRRFEQ